MKQIVFMLMLFLTMINAQQFDEYTKMLKRHVHDGMVDYANLKDDPDFKVAVHKIETTNPEELTQNESLAFWINAYNIFTLKVVAENFPIESINDLHTGGLYLGSVLGTTVWDKELFTVNGRKISLDKIEHEILRKEFNEPRIHFAIVCASISCPALSDEAYTEAKIDKQLDDRTKILVYDESKNYFDFKSETAYLSSIFDWFDEDFGNDETDVLKFAAQFLPAEKRSELLSGIDEWEVEYKSYDWGLNDINHAKN